jgi:hypothetical protein
VRTQKYLTVLFEGHADAADEADDEIPTDSARQNRLQGGSRNLEEISRFVRDRDPLLIGPIFQWQAVASKHLRHYLAHVADAGGELPLRAVRPIAR